MCRQTCNKQADFKTFKKKNQKKDYPTCDNMWVDVKRVIDGVDGAPPKVPLTEGERASVNADARHISVPSQWDLR